MVGELVGRWLGTQGAVAAGGVRAAAPVQVERRVPGPRQGPRGLRPPDVLAHHKDADWRLVVVPFVDPFQPAIEETQTDSVVIEESLIAAAAVIDLSHQVGERRGVGPGTDQETLSASGLRSPPFVAHADEVGEGPAEENVVPAANVQRRDINCVVVLSDV